MRETDLRKWHRNLGIALVLFVILQAGSGLLISFTELAIPKGHTHNELPTPQVHHEERSVFWSIVLSYIHLGGESIGAVYRILIGLAILSMSVSGILIFFKIRARSGKRYNTKTGILSHAIMAVAFGRFFA